MTQKIRFFLLFFISLQPLYSMSHSQINKEEIFYVSDIIKDKVRFWEKIFYIFPVSSYVIHDEEDPSIIIDIIDINTFVKENKLKDYPSKKKQDKIVKDHLNRYKLALRRFSKEHIKAKQYGSVEKRLFQKYKDNPKNIMKLYQNKIKLHVQQGLSDEIKMALKRSKKLLPRIENIFKNKKLPLALTRIPFIESMFRNEAVSKSGAAGLWQFMPITAKKYLIINDTIDERFSPIKSTYAAAEYLNHMYKYFDSWPLVVNAYNHGLTGILKARDSLRTNRIEFIIKYYQSKSYKYASKNYYPEFVAINNIIDTLTRLNKKQPTQTEKYFEIKLNEDLSLFEVTKETQISPHTLIKYNPCLKKFDFKNYRKKLPKNYSFLLPKALIKRKILSKKLTSRIF